MDHDLNRSTSVVKQGKGSSALRKVFSWILGNQQGVRDQSANPPQSCIVSARTLEPCMVACRLSILLVVNPGPAGTDIPEFDFDFDSNRDRK